MRSRLRATGAHDARTLHGFLGSSSLRRSPRRHSRPLRPARRRATFRPWPPRSRTARAAGLRHRRARRCAASRTPSIQARVPATPARRPSSTPRSRACSAAWRPAPAHGRRPASPGRAQRPTTRRSRSRARLRSAACSSVGGSASCRIQLEDLTSGALATVADESISTADPAFVTRTMALDPSLLKAAHSYRLRLTTNLSAAALLSGIRVVLRRRTPERDDGGDGDGERERRRWRHRPERAAAIPPCTSPKSGERAERAAPAGARRRALHARAPADGARARHARGQGRRASRDHAARGDHGAEDHDRSRRHRVVHADPSGTGRGSHHVPRGRGRSDHLGPAPVSREPRRAPADHAACIRGHRGRLRQRHAVAPGAAALRADHRPRAGGHHGRPRPPAVRRRAAERRGQRPGPSDPGKRHDRLVLRRPDRDAERDRAVSARALERCRGHACLFPACRAAGRRAVHGWPRLGRSTGHAARLQRRLARARAERLRSLLLQVGDADRRALRQRGPGCQAHAPARDRDGRAHSRRGWPPQRRAHRGPAHGRLPDQQRILRPRVRRPRGAGPERPCGARGVRAPAQRCAATGARAAAGRAALERARPGREPGPPGRLLDRAAAGLDDRNRSAPRRCLRGGLARAHARPRPARGGCGDRVRPHGPAVCCEPGASPRIATRAPANAASSPTRSAPRRSPARSSHGLASRARGGVPRRSLDRGTRGRGSPRTRALGRVRGERCAVGGEASRLVVAQVAARGYESGFAFAVESETRMRVDVPELHDALAGACRSLYAAPFACPARGRSGALCLLFTDERVLDERERAHVAWYADEAAQALTRARSYEHEHAVAIEPPAQPALAGPAADRRRRAAAATTRPGAQVSRSAATGTTSFAATTAPCRSPSETWRAAASPRPS